MFAILYLCKNIFLKSNENFTGEVLDFLKDLTIIVVIVLVIRTFFVMPFQINGQSMYESYYDKEFIIVDRFSYFMKKPIA
jgi:signal peptidase I